MSTVKRTIPRVYIAGKFRGRTNAEVQRYIDVASWFQAPIAEAGAMPVCVHIMEGLKMHDVQQADNGAFWLAATMDELRTCDAVVLIPGWQTSSGSYYEAQEALYLGIPVFEASWDVAVDDFDMPVPASVDEWGPVRAIAGVVGDATAIWADSTVPDFGDWLFDQRMMREAV